MQLRAVEALLITATGWTSSCCPVQAPCQKSHAYSCSCCTIAQSSMTRHAHLRLSDIPSLCCRMHSELPVRQCSSSAWSLARDHNTVPAQPTRCTLKQGPQCAPRRCPSLMAPCLTDRSPRHTCSSTASLGTQASDMIWLPHVELTKHGRVAVGRSGRPK